jgi:hypothetical protein
MEVYASCDDFNDRQGIDWVSIGYRLGIDWVSIGYRLGIDWVSIGYRLGIDWGAVGYRLGSGWGAVGERLGSVRIPVKQASGPEFQLGSSMDCQCFQRNFLAGGSVLWHDCTRLPEFVRNGKKLHRRTPGARRTQSIVHRSLRRRNAPWRPSRPSVQLSASDNQSRSNKLRWSARQR